MYSKNRGRMAFVIAACLMATSAWAGNDNSNGGCQGNCSGGGTTTNQGGAGGNGYGGSANQGQLQGQLQGQAQIGINQSTNRVNASAVSGSSSASGGSAFGGNVGAVAGGNAQGGTGNANGNGVGNTTTLTQTYEAQARDPVATAYSAGLTASNGTCMGSSSAGAQGTGLGLSFGTTWVDTGCDIRFDATALAAAGLAKAAVARLCQKADIAKAMEAAGTPCPGTPVAKKAETSQPVTVSSAVNAGSTAQYADPIIRQRLGLPPLK